MHNGIVREKGSAPLLIIVVIALLLIAGGAFFYFSKQKQTKAPTSTVAPVQTASASATLKEEYKNPFDDKTQYQNPFSENENPFNNIQ